MKIKDICTSVTDGSHNPPQGIEKSEYMMLSSKNIFDDEITFDEPRFLSQKDFEREHKRTNIAVGDVLLTYTARHTWATLARESGAPISIISAGLGHTSEEMTRVYLKEFDQETLARVNRIVTNLL